MLPNVPLPPEELLNEYQQRIADLTAGNIRLTVMVREVTKQRDLALRHVAELQAQNGAEPGKRVA